MPYVLRCLPRPAVTLAALLVACRCVPAQEPVAVVEIASYKQLAADTMALGMHVQNPMLNMGLLTLSNALGAPGLLGLDQERPIRLALFADQGDLRAVERLLLLPIMDDGAKYLEVLTASYTVVEDDGRVRRFRANRDVPSFQEMSVALAGGYAVVSPSRPLLERVLAWIEADPNRMAITGIGGTVSVAIDPGAVLPALRQRLDAQARAAEAGGAEGPADAMNGMLRVYTAAIIDVLEQAQSVKLALQCNAHGLTVYGRLDALPDTKLATFFSEFREPSERLLRLLPPEALVSYGSGMLGSLMRHVMEPYMAFLNRLMEAQQHMLAAIGGEAPTARFDMTQVMDQIKPMLETYGDEMVAALMPPADGRPMVFFSAITVRDGGKLLASLDRQIQVSNEMHAGMRIPMRFSRREGRTVDGVEVLVFGAELTPAEVAAGEIAAAMQAEMVAQLAWMTQGVAEMAVVDDLALLTFGAPGSLDPYLARLPTSGTDDLTQRCRALFPDLRNADRSAERWSLKLLATLRAVAPLFSDDADLREALALLPDDGPGMGGLTMASPTAAMSAFRVSAPQIGALVRSVQTLQRLARTPVAPTGRPPEAPVAGAPVEVVLPED